MQLISIFFYSREWAYCSLEFLELGMGHRYLCKILKSRVHRRTTDQNLIFIQHGNFAHIFYSENAGLLALTHVGSRRVVQISAGFMIFFSVLGKLVIHEYIAFKWTCRGSLFQLQEYALKIHVFFKENSELYLLQFRHQLLELCIAFSLPTMVSIQNLEKTQKQLLLTCLFFSTLDSNNLLILCIGQAQQVQASSSFAI